MSYKRLTPCIFIAGGKAVRWFDDRTVLTEDVIALAKQYNANGADELLVFDLSDSDEDHEESVCRGQEYSVYHAQVVRDYAGC